MKFFITKSWKLAAHRIPCLEASGGLPALDFEFRRRFLGLQHHLRTKYLLQRRVLVRDLGHPRAVAPDGRTGERPADRTLG